MKYNDLLEQRVNFTDQIKVIFPLSNVHIWNSLFSEFLLAEKKSKCIQKPWRKVCDRWLVSKTHPPERNRRMHLMQSTG